MTFNSLQFISFFFLINILYFSLPHKYRWILLLTGSYYFYMCWKANYIVLILLSTLTAYYCGLLMGRENSKIIRKIFLLISLIINIGLLFTFKYFNFLNDSVSSIFDFFNLQYNIPMLNVLLPVGISFYTFQTLSYLIDVYKEEKKPERHFGIFALYISFFPQLVAGPIERSTRLLPQFKKKIYFDNKRFVDGIFLMLWGFFKKLVIADRLAVIVNQVYNNPTDHTGVPLIMASYAFAFQIYCDFSGYSDIAIGSARLLGYDLMKNFDSPYFSKSISEFWRRWHISLSSWFRDYLYIPLGGNRVPLWRNYLNIVIVFFITGLWHGANWTFVIWGLLHAFYMLFSRWTYKIREKIINLLFLNKWSSVLNIIKIFITFHLVVFGWIFFRANSISDAIYIISNLFTGINIHLRGYGMGLGPIELFIVFFAILLIKSVEILQRKFGIWAWLVEKPLILRWSVFYFIGLFTLFLGYFGEGTEFIYFQF